MGVGDLHAVPVTGRQHAICHIERWRHWLFRIDGLDSGLSGGDGHRLVLVEPTRPNGDQIDALLREHIAVVGVGALGARAPHSLLPPLTVGVGQGNELHVR